MTGGIDVRPNDRVLLLSIPEMSLVFGLAARLTAGVLVGLGQDEEVRTARRAARELNNVMFVAAPPEEVPWQDGFFSVAVDAACRWERPAQVAAELARVLGPGGQVYLRRSEAARAAMLAAGFREVASDEALLALRR